jgi:hypothetical protein
LFFFVPFQFMNSFQPPHPARVFLLCLQLVRRGVLLQDPVQMFPLQPSPTHERQFHRSHDLGGGGFGTDFGRTPHVGHQIRDRFL